MPTKKPITFTFFGTLSLSGRRADAYRLTLARTRALEAVLADQIQAAVHEAVGGDVLVTLTPIEPDGAVSPRLPEVAR